MGFAIQGKVMVSPHGRPHPPSHVYCTYPAMLPSLSRLLCWLVLELRQRNDIMARLYTRVFWTDDWSCGKGLMLPIPGSPTPSKAQLWGEFNYSFCLEERKNTPLPVPSFFGQMGYQP